MQLFHDTKSVSCQIQICCTDPFASSSRILGTKCDQDLFSNGDYGGGRDAWTEVITPDFSRHLPGVVNPQLDAGAVMEAGHDVTSMMGGNMASICHGCRRNTGQCRALGRGKTPICALFHSVLPHPHVRRRSTLAESTTSNQAYQLLIQMADRTERVTDKGTNAADWQN